MRHFGKLPLVGEDRPGLELYIYVYMWRCWMGAAFLQVAFAISTFLEIINVFKENKEKKNSSALKIELWSFFFPLRLSVTFQEWKTVTQMGWTFSLKSSDN